MFKIVISNGEGANRQVESHEFRSESETVDWLIKNLKEPNFEVFRDSMEQYNLKWILWAKVVDSPDFKPPEIPKIEIKNPIKVVAKKKVKEPPEIKAAIKLLKKNGYFVSKTA